MAGLTPYNTLTNSSTSVKLQFLGYLLPGVTAAVYYNEPVVADPDNPGYLKSLRAVAGGAQQTTPIVGVVKEIDFTDSNVTSQTAGALPKPWGNQQQTLGNKPGKVWGYMDPYLLYAVPGATVRNNFYTALYGQTSLAFNEQNPADSMGYSTARLVVDNVTQADQAIVQANGQFKIVNYLSDTGSNLAIPDGNWVVVINNNVFNKLTQAIPA